VTPEEKAAAKVARDKAICDHYVAGNKLKAVASQFKLGRWRTMQILRAGGVWKPYEKSGRTEFVGVNVTPETKKALARKADEEGDSMSKIASDLLDGAVGE
jgi:hypothetical protein